jgi:HEPN domain-containing protein/predicted nucleotidyltransferase
MTIPEELIAEIVRRILRATSPDAIILYGSAATGTMTPESDIDLLVLERSPANTREERRRLDEALRDLPFPADVWTLSTHDFEEAKNVIGGFAYPAHKHGRRIYAAEGVPPIEGPFRSEEEVRRDFVQWWLSRAASALASAEQLAQQGDLASHAAFYAREAVERFLKALLVHHQVEMPKTHGTVEFLECVAAVDAALAAALDDARELHAYQDLLLEPGSPEVTDEQVVRALQVARKVGEAVRSRLAPSGNPSRSLP